MTYKELAQKALDEPDPKKALELCQEALAMGREEVNENGMDGKEEKVRKGEGDQEHRDVSGTSQQETLGVLAGSAHAPETDREHDAGHTAEGSET